MKVCILNFIANNDFYGEQIAIKSNADLWKHIDKLNELAQNGESLETLKNYINNNCEVIPSFDYTIDFTNK